MGLWVPAFAGTTNVIQRAYLLLKTWDDSCQCSAITPGPHGKFDVIIDGEVIAEHRHEPNAHIFPDIEDLMKAIAQRAD